MNRNSRVTAAQGQVSTDLGGEVAILHFTSGRYYSLRDVAARVWELIQTPTTLGDVLKTLVDEFDVDPGRCENDLIGLLHELKVRDLVVIEVGGREGEEAAVSDHAIPHVTAQSSHPA